MTQTLEARTRQELPDLVRRENNLNFVRHLPAFYIAGSTMLKPFLLYNQNPFEYMGRDSTSMTMLLTGLALGVAGTILKSENDGEDMKTICANIKNSENPSMVETGMYSQTRHPCYFAQTIMSAGFLVMSPALDTALAFAAYLGLTKKTAEAEERKNLAQFGDKYKRYMKKVPRWPKLSGISKMFGYASKSLS